MTLKDACGMCNLQTKPTVIMQAYGSYIASQIMMSFHYFHTNYSGTKQVQCKMTIQDSHPFTDRHAWRSTKQY